MTTHDLKVWPQYFDVLLDGTKTFEARRDDRGYAVGDVLHLREWDPAVYDIAYVNALEGDGTLTKATDAAYTGRSMTRCVTYVLRGGPWLAEGYVVLGLTDPDRAPTALERLADAAEQIRQEYNRVLAATVTDEGLAVLKRLNWGMSHLAISREVALRELSASSDVAQTHNGHHEPSPTVGAASSSVAAALIEQRIADGAPATFATPADTPADR